MPPICSNPKETRIRVSVLGGDAAVILVVRDYNGREYEKFMNSRWEVKRQGKVKDHSYQAKIEFIDSILIGLEGEDENRKKDTVTFIDPADGVEKDLTPSVENWLIHVNPAWKISAAAVLEERNAEIEAGAVKN